MSEKRERSADPKAIAASDSIEETADEARRDVLKRLGVYGAFAAPAILTVLSSKASAQVIVESGGTGLRPTTKKPPPPQDSEPQP